MRRRYGSSRVDGTAHRPRVIALGLGVVLALTGCGWWGSSETGATTPPGSAASAPPDGSATPTTTPSSSPTSTVTPSSPAPPESTPSSPAPSDSTPSSPAPTATAPSAPAPSPPVPGPTGGGTTGAPPFVADTRPDTGTSTGPDVGTLSDLRLGAHPGYDRVVLEFDGPDTPGWRVRYVDRAIEDGSGLVLPVDGDTILEITCSPVTYPFDGRNPFTGPQALRVAGTTAVVGVSRWGIYEGDLQAFVGISGGEHPFRAFDLSNPARVVIDVRTD